MAELYTMLQQDTTKLVREYEAFLCGLIGPESSEGSQQDSVLAEYYALRDFGDIKARHESNVLSVALLSLTKSGKSTFLNALLGMDCMPMGTVPETARICRIIHSPDSPEPILVEANSTATGSAQVRRRLHELNNEVRQREHCILDEDALCISAPLAALAGQAPIPTQLHLLDTPGPNEAGEEGLRYQVERLLDGVGVLVYLLDCTKLKTQEEEHMFRRLQDINPQLLQRLSKRLFFIVNKKDILSGDDMSERDVQEYVADLVTAQMGRGDFRLDPDHVMLMSAKTALYSRMVMAGTADEKQERELAKLAFGALGSRGKTSEECREAAQLLMEDSGMREVEERLLTFLYTHSGRIQLLGTLDDIGRHLSRVLNTVSASEAALKRDFQELSDRVCGMTAQLESVLGRFSEVYASTAELETGVTEDITARMQTLKERLFEQVDAVLSGADSSAPPPRLKPQWQGLWGRIREILGQAPEVASENQRANQAQNRLADLYLCVNTQIEAEVRAFWHSLEVAANSRQQHLFSLVNAKLQELSAAAEGVLSHRLDVQLEPANLSMEAPSFSRQHSDISALFAEGIIRNVTEREEVQEVASTVIEKRYAVPLCRYGEYYVARPVTTRETFTIKETNFELDAERVKGFFMGHINGMVEASVRSVRGVVRNLIRQKVEAARTRLATYCDSFQAEMRAALDEGVEGEVQRRAAFGRACDRLRLLRDLKQRLEVLVEKADGAGTEEEEEIRAALPTPAELLSDSMVLVGEAEDGHQENKNKEVLENEGPFNCEGAGQEEAWGAAVHDQAMLGNGSEDAPDKDKEAVSASPAIVNAVSPEEVEVICMDDQPGIEEPKDEDESLHQMAESEQESAEGDQDSAEDGYNVVEAAQPAAHLSSFDDNDQQASSPPVIPVIQMSPLPVSTGTIASVSNINNQAGVAAASIQVTGAKFDYEEGFQDLAASTVERSEVKPESEDEEEGFVVVS